MTHKTHYDTLSTYGFAPTAKSTHGRARAHARHTCHAESRTRAWFLEKRARKLGLTSGGGRLAKFREVARFLPTPVEHVIEGRLSKVVESEYWFYVWNVGPVLCVYCNEKLTRTTKTKDHVVPRARGGARLGRTNLMPACRRCNGDKGHKSLLVYLCTRALN